MLQVLFSGFYALGGELSSEMREAFRATETVRSPQISWKEQTHAKMSHHAALRNMINFDIFQLSLLVQRTVRDFGEPAWKTEG